MFKYRYPPSGQLDRFSPIDLHYPIRCHDLGQRRPTGLLRPPTREQRTHHYRDRLTGSLQKEGILQSIRLPLETVEEGNRQLFSALSDFRKLFQSRNVCRFPEIVESLQKEVTELRPDREDRTREGGPRSEEEDERAGSCTPNTPSHQPSTAPNGGEAIPGKRRSPDQGGLLRCSPRARQDDKGCRATGSMAM